MKNVKYILGAFIATFALAGCSDDPTYTKGGAENTDSYGVYFPSQTAATDVELDPEQATILTFEIARSKSEGEITVPVTVTATPEEVFTVAPIVFADGQEKTDVTVTFPRAEIGVTYDCNIVVTDPDYVFTYGGKATGLDFSVTRVKWNTIDADKTITYNDQAYTGYEWYTDDMLNAFFKTGTPTYPVKVQVRDDSIDADYPNGKNGLAGIYRLLDAYGELYPYNEPGDYTPNTYIIINAENPQQVYIPTQKMGVAWSSYGDMYIYSFAYAYRADPTKAAPYYGKIEAGALTFPAKALLISMANYDGNGTYYANNNAAFRLVLCQDQVVDYSLSLAAAEPADGKVDIAAQLGTDIKNVKYAFLEGTFSAADIETNAADITSGKIASKSIAATGTVTAELEKTGIYTMIANGYNAAGAAVVTKSVSFGFVAAGDKKPVVLTIGLDVTDKNTPQGYTSENSVVLWAYGEEIVSGYYGVFETDKLDPEADLAALVKSEGKVFTAAHLEKMNGTGFSGMIGDLVSGTDYTAVVLAFNGYVSEVFTATATTNGVPHPLKRSYTLADLSEETLKTDYLKTWNYYAGSVSGGVRSGKRAKIGTVTITNNTTDNVEGETDYVNVAGLSGIADKIGGDDTMLFDFYGGLLYSIKQQIVGEYQGYPVSYWNTTTSGGGYNANYALLGGVVEDGYIAFVANPNYISGNGLTFDGFRFMAFADETLGTAVGALTWYYNLMLADPTADAANPLSVAAAPAFTAAQLGAIAQEASVVPNNFVELRDRERMHAIIDEYRAKNRVANQATTLVPVEYQQSARVAKASVSFREGVATVNKSAKMELRKDLKADIVVK